MRELILFEIRELTLGVDGLPNYRFKGMEVMKLVNSMETLPDIELLDLFKRVVRRSFAQH